MATLQVKGLDDAIYRALGARAVMDNRSISQEVVMMIREFLARPSPAAEVATEAFLALAGSWADKRFAQTILREIRKSRQSTRRFKRSTDVFA